MTHQSVMTHNLIKHQKFKNWQIFTNVIDYIINQCGPRRPKGASGNHKVSACLAAQVSEARLLQ